MEALVSHHQHQICRDLKHISKCPLLLSKFPVAPPIVTDAGVPSRIIINPQMYLVLKQGSDRRHKNLLTGDEVAAIIQDGNSDPGSRDIVLAPCWRPAALSPH
jgi:hypothetical protein